MKGILALGTQDFKRLLKNALFWVITATLIIIIAVINFVLPRDISSSSYKVFTYNMSAAVPDATSLSSEAELREAVKAEGTIGLIQGADGQITVIHPGLSEKAVSAIMVTLFTDASVALSVESITGSSRFIPFNERMTPVFISFEALIIGFILAGALMLSEKEEGTIRALRISPMGTDRYLLSKTLLFSIIGTVYALLMAFFCVGAGFSVAAFILLSFTGAAVYSLIGLAFSTLFRDMSSWFFSMALLLSVNMLPVIAYSEPSFSPVWLRIIPSYPIIFAYERILFNTGGNSAAVVLTLAAWCVGAYLLGRFAVGRYLLQKGGQKV